LLIDLSSKMALVICVLWQYHQVKELPSHSSININNKMQSTS